MAPPCYHSPAHLRPCLHGAAGLHVCVCTPGSICTCVLTCRYLCYRVCLCMSVHAAHLPACVCESLWVCDPVCVSVTCIRSVPVCFQAIVCPCVCGHSFFLRFYLFVCLFVCLFLERGEGREKNINVWLTLTYPQLGIWLTTQACALTGNQTGDPLVHRPVLNPLSHASQGRVKTF